MNLSIKTLAVTVAHADGTLEYDAHNLYGMYEVKSTAQALRSIRGRRHFILTRCAPQLRSLHTGCVSAGGRYARHA